MHICYGQRQQDQTHAVCEDIPRNSVLMKHSINVNIYSGALFSPYDGNQVLSEGAATTYNSVFLYFLSRKCSSVCYYLSNTSQKQTF